MLDEAGIENAGREAEWLLEAAASSSRTQLVAAMEEDVSELTEHRALKLASRRAAGEPLQYLTGVAGFRRLELEVGPGVFIPRAETELVAERAMERLPEEGFVLDIGTGSGAICLAIADERPDAYVFATESSPEALAWARRNHDRTGRNEKVVIVEGDLFGGLHSDVRGALDVVVSNPPYVADTDVHLLGDDVRDHEPHEALFAGIEGLLVVESIADEARSWLRPGGWLVLEIGYDQAAKVADVLTRLGYEEVSVSQDLAGKDRIVEARWPDEQR